MFGSIMRNVRWRVTAVVGLVVLPLVALACSTPGGGGVPGAPPVPRPDPTSTLDRGQSLIDDPINDALTTDFNMHCGGSVTVAGAAHPFAFDQDATANVDAPATVHDGDHFSVWVTPGDWTVPSQVVSGNTYPISSVGSFLLVLPLPALSGIGSVPVGAVRAQYVDAVMTGSVPADLGYPQLQVVNGALWYTLDGPMTGGTTISLPRVRIDFIAHSTDQFEELDWNLSLLKVTAKSPNGFGGNYAVGVACHPTSPIPNQPFPPFSQTFVYPVGQ
jgi:hypothetical protein